MRHCPCRLLAGVPLAALTAALPCQAQSSISLNGLLDIGVFRDFGGVRRVGTLQRSNVALSGVEDLGGGLQAVFRLSTRLELDTGASEGAGFKPFWHDESTVGLKGGWGTVRLGRALTALWAHDWKFDPWANFNRIASPAWQQWHYLTPSDPLGNNGTAEYGRINNGLFYDSPQVAGFTLRLSSSPERQRTAEVSRRPVSAVLEYGQGPLAAMAAFERNSAGADVRFLAARYRFGAASVMAAHDDSRAALRQDRSRATTLGATYRIDRTTLKAGYGHQRLDAGAQRFTSLGADHALSARTTLYASLGHRRDVGAGGRTALGVGVSHGF